MSFSKDPQSLEAIIEQEPRERFPAIDGGMSVDESTGCYLIKHGREDLLDGPASSARASRMKAMPLGV
jgi:hypothetical protein